MYFGKQGCYRLGDAYSWESQPYPDGWEIEDAARADSNGDGFVDACVGNDSCDDMACDGDCDQVAYIDDCGECDDSVNTDCVDISLDLHIGANLISFPSSETVAVPDALPDEAEDVVGGVIAEGGACSQISPGTWVGSQCSFIGGKGYWMILDEEVSLSFINGCDEPECASLSRKSQNLSTIPDGYDYRQSTAQAFYFFESIENIP